MIVNIEGTKFYTIETISDCMYDGYETYEQAETAARKSSYNSGKEVAIMAPVAIAKAPPEVNTVVIEKV